MAFLRCSASYAETFVEFMLKSGAWKSEPVHDHIAYRLVKARPTTEDELCHAKIDTLVIHKNAKGVHSFDPVFEKAFTAAIASTLSTALEGMVGEHLGEVHSEAVRNTLLKGIMATLPEAFQIKDSRLTPDGQFEVTISLSREIAEKMGVV